MGGIEMPVDFTDEDATVLMPAPASNREGIHSTHYAKTDEEMAKIMKVNPRQTRSLSDQPEDFMRVLEATVSLPGSR